jgi:copper(I)-binding protein
MSHPTDRRQLLQVALATGLATLLPSARACEFFSATLRVTHPWTRASAPQADTAIISMKFDDVLESDRLIGIETPVASGAELGGTRASAKLPFDIPAGQETLFSEEGTFVRLTGLKRPLELGRSYPLILVFERGGRVATDLSVDFK